VRATSRVGTLIATLALILHSAGVGAGEPARQAEVLEFSIRDGVTLNQFYRSGPVAAHLVLSSGTEPRLLVAFPAGNSGVSLWFEPVASATGRAEVLSVTDVATTAWDDRLLYGIDAELRVRTGPLTVHKAVLGSIRVIRNYMHERELDSALGAGVDVDGNRVTWYRDRLDGNSAYSLAVEARDGRVIVGADSAVTFVPPQGGPLRLHIVALTGDPPLTPIETGELLLPGALDDPLSKNVLAFLSYREKLLAGSWRFCTYFGRDTLLSLRLLMPVVSGTVVEAGIGSVLERLKESGEVAHEEDIGEFAVLRHMGADHGTTAAPIYDYKMIDDDFMLAPIAARYLLDRPDGRAGAREFLRRRTRDGRSYGEALVSNFRLVLASGRPFALQPAAARLIRLRDGESAGEWRDSDEGLARGRIPYDVNAVLVPAALTAVMRLHDSGLLAEYEVAADHFGDAGTLAATWSTEAPGYFEIDLDRDQALHDVSQYAARIGVPAQTALDALARLPERDRTAWRHFDALALDAEGRPIPVRHTDTGFALLFGRPAVADLESAALSLTLPFPAGMLTPVGLVVANPVHASAEVQSMFTSNHYHGTVIWSWQQAMFAAGLARQLQRDDLSPALRRRLHEAQQRLWQVIEATNASRTSELWSWSFTGGAYRLEPFGAHAEHLTESNAAQLWSTVYLGVPPP
jgi:hypothetical protein